MRYLLTSSIRNIDTSGHWLHNGREFIVRRAVVVRYRRILVAPSALRRFPRLVMAQVADIALYTSGAGPLL